MADQSFGAVITAMVTPFTNAHGVDYDKAAKLAARLLDSGSDGLVVAGTTGESPTLTEREKLELFRVVKDALAGRGKVIAGTTNYCTEESIALTREAENVGVDAILAVSPYYNRPSQEGLFQHYKAVAAATSLPVILYNVPSRTGRNIEAKTTIRLANEVSNIVGIKEASGDFVQAARIRAGAPEDFMIYSGDDSATIHILAVGGCGIVSVASHVAGKQIGEMISAFLQGDVKGATRWHLRLLPLFDILFIPTSVNPVPVKAALRLCGFDPGPVRLPLVELTEAETESIRAELSRQGLIG